MQRSVSLAAVVAFAFSCIRTGLGTITFCHIPLDVWNKDGGLSNLTLNLSPCSEAVLSTSHSLFDLHSPDVNKSRSAQTALEEILTLRWRFPSVRYTLSLRSKHYGRPSVNLLLNEAVVIYLSLYLRFFQIDGIDLPLSYVEATPDDQWQHFRNYLSSRGVRVSTTVVDEIEADEFQRVRRISDRLDRIFLAPGGSSFFSPWHRSPVVAVFDSLELNVGIFLKTYTSLNLSLDKLIVGLAIESIQWTDSDQRHVVGDRSALVGRKATLDLLPYWRTCDSMEDDGWLQHDHPTNPFVQAAVAPSRQKWLFQMNPDVVTAKADLMARYGFGGIMLYDLHVDDYLGKCTSSAGEPYPLAKALSRAIKAVATAELDDLHEIADDCIPFLGISSGCSDETGSVRDLPLSSEAENEADPPSTQRVNCSDSTFECTFNQTCIPLWWKCDGQTDCGDGADEADCPEETARGSDSPQLRSLHWQPTDELSVENSTWLESEQIEGRIDILPVVYEDDFNSDYFASEIPFDGANSTDISPAVESPGDSSPESSRSYEHETGADINFTGTPPNPVRAEFAGAGGRTERSETSTESDEYFIDYESLKTELNDGEEHFDDFTTFVETSTAMNQAGTSATVPELDPFEHSSAADEFTEKATEGSGSADYSTGETAQRPGNPTPSIDLNDFTEVPADAPATEYPEEAVAQTQTETNEANDSISSAEDEEYLFDDYESLMTKLLVREEPYDLMDYVQTTTEMNEHSTETRTFTRDPSGVVSTTVSEPDTLEYSGQGSAEFYTEDPSDFSISTEETTESVQYTTTIDSNELIDYFDATDSISDMELFTAWPWEDFTSEEASTQSPISSQTVADSQLEDAAGEPTYSPTFESSTWSPTWSETVESTNAAGSEESTAHWLQMADHLYEDGVTDVDWLLETEDDDYAISTDWETWSLSETVFTETTAPAFPSATETQLIGQTTELPIAVSTAHYEPGDADSDKPCRTGSCGIPGPIPTATGGTPQQQPIVSVTGARNSLIVQINAVLNLPDTGSVAALFDLWTRWNEIPGSPQRCHLAGNSTLLSVLLCGAQVGQQPVETTPSSSFD